MILEKKHSVLPLLIVMLFDHTCLNITFPVLTFLFFDLQSSLFSADTSYTVRSMWYGICVAMPHLINIVCTPVLSALSDEFGRKKILLVGTLGAFGFALTAAFGVVYGALSCLLFARVIQGAFSRTNPIAQAVIGDISSSDKKIENMGYLQLSISIGAFVGPVIGGYFANKFLFSSLNFSLPFFIAAFFGAISFIMTVIIFKETLIVEKTTKNLWRCFDLTMLKKLLLDPTILRISAILLLTQLSWSTYYQFIPPVLKTTLGFNAHQLGIFVGLIALWLALTTAFGIKLLRNFFNLKQMLSFSLYLLLFGLILTLVFCNFHNVLHGNNMIWIAAIPTAVGDVMAYSCMTAMYSDAVRKQEQGKVMGVCSLIVALMWSLTGVIGGLLMSFNTLLPLVVAPIGTMIAVSLARSKYLYGVAAEH